MTQRSFTPQSASLGSEPVARPVDQLREWYGDAAGRVGRALLPDGDHHDDLDDRDGRPESVTGASNGPGVLGHRVLLLIPRTIVGFAVLLFVIAIGLFAFRSFYNDRIYPAVIIGDVPVGGLTTGQAENRIAKRAAELEQGTITFSYGGQTWTPALSELGATVDLDRSISEARSLGRGDDARSRLAFTGEILRDDELVALRTVVDQSVLNAWFDKVDIDIGRPAVNAQIQLSGTQVSISPDATGIVVDREAATTTILGTLTSLTPSNLELPTVIEQPKIYAAELQEVQSDVQNALSRPVRVEFESKSWRIEADMLAQYLTVTTLLENGKPTANLTIDQDTLAAALRDQYTAEVNRKPTNARVAWSDSNGMIALDPSTTGITLKASEFASVVTGSFLSDHENVQIPVVVTRPEIDSENLAALKINTPLARGTSNFEGGSEARDTNIVVGTDLLNGTLVRPGEEFSFNGAVGEITADKGYVEAGVVVADRTGKDIGGGICQVSTTVFRAALLSGLPITKWYPHTYRISGYERDGWRPGYDASILQLGSDPANWGDFRFENTTSGWLLVESWTAYPHVVVNIYGEDMGTTVDFVDEWQSDPITDNDDLEVVNPDLPAGTIKQTEYPLDGLEVAFTRVVTDKNGKEIANREFYTPFSGRGNVYEVSPDMAGQAVDD